MIGRSNRRIGIFGNAYSLLIYLLMENEKNINNTIFLIENNLKELKLNNKIIFLKNSKYKLIILIHRFYCLIKCFYIEKRYKLEKIDVYGNDHIPIAFYFLKKHNFYVIEEGLANYEKLPKVKEKPMLYFFSKLGRTKMVKKIFLTGLSKIPIEINNKVEIIELKKLYSQKNISEIEMILKVFNLEKVNLENLKAKKYILFTQPLSEDGYLSENEKVEIYDKIIKKYPKKDLIIKTHPREITNYKEKFGEIDIITEIFPAEIFNIIGLKFEIVITAFSTSVFSIEASKIDFYGTEIHPKLLKKFGSMDDLIKRNAFL